jgi:hypothetical protein
MQFKGTMYCFFSLLKEMHGYDFVLEHSLMYILLKIQYFIAVYINANTSLVHRFSKQKYV